MTGDSQRDPKLIGPMREDNGMVSAFESEPSFTIVVLKILVPLDRFDSTPRAMTCDPWLNTPTGSHRARCIGAVLAEHSLHPHERTTCVPNMVGIGVFSRSNGKSNLTSELPVIEVWTHIGGPGQHDVDISWHVFGEETFGSMTMSLITVAEIPAAQAFITLDVSYDSSLIDIAQCVDTLVEDVLSFTQSGCTIGSG